MKTKALTATDRIKAFERKQIVVSLLGLLLFIGVALFFNSFYMRSLAEQSTRLISRLVQSGDFREVGLILEEARLDNFTKITYETKGSSTTFPVKSMFMSETSFIQRLSTDEVSFFTSQSLVSNQPDQVVFEFNRFRFVPAAFFLWLLLILVSIPQTRYMKRRLVEKFEEELVIERKVARSEIARKVRHNLRTPLAAIMRIPSRLPASVKEETELLQSIILQMKALIADLDERDSSQLGDSISTDIYSSILNSFREIGLIIPEKIQFGYDVDDSIHSALTTHTPHELRSVLGNILNNSIDAIGDGSGEVQCKVEDLGGKIKIEIIDTGCGMSPEVLERACETGFSSGKSGSGIGLAHAKEWIENWGGRLSIESKPMSGTRVQIFLPIDNRASWYLPRLKIKQNSKVVVLDDQETARNLWKARIKELGLEGQLKVFSSPKELEALQRDIDECSEQYIFLFDYDLRHQKNGLDLLKKLPPHGQRVLVTGHFDQEGISEACGENNIYLLPKSYVNELPIISV